MDKLLLDELASQINRYGYTDKDGKHHTNNEKFYPIIKTPQQLIDIKTEKIDSNLLFPFPIITRKTIDLEIPKEPVKPKSLFMEIAESIVTTLMGGLSCFSLWYIQLPIITNVIFILGPTSIIKGIINFWLAIRDHEDYKDNQNIYLKNYDHYLRALSRYEYTSKKIEEDYCFQYKINENITIPDVKNKRHEFDNNINNVQTNYRNLRLREVLASTILPSKLNNIDDYTKGFTEIFFYKKLIKHFPDKILTDHTIQSNFSKSYLPDFIYFDREINLVIDIEIDEPYIASSKIPIHHKESNDFIRDDFFLNKTWTVIRFAEEQIVKHPDECCQLIEKVIASIINIEDIGCKYHSDLNIDIVPLWTFEESNKLAKRNFREGYLKNLHQ